MEDSKLKIALVSTDVEWGDIAANLAHIGETLRQIEPGTDVVVLPEMFSTGFIIEPTLLCSFDKDSTEHTLRRIHEWAEKYNFAICGSLIAVDDENRYFNRAFFIEPSGDETFYDKHHLFSMGGEARTYTPGEKESKVVRFRGCNIKMSVCYDLRFPVWNRNVDNAYDLLIFPANWPDSRLFAWEHLLIARAIENQAYVIGCNRTGSDDFGTYSPGHSYLVSDWGENIGVTDSIGVVYGTVDLGSLDRHRRKFSCWKDADPFIILPKE